MKIRLKDGTMADIEMWPTDMIEHDYDDSSGEPVCVGRRIIRASGEVVELSVPQKR